MQSLVWESIAFFSIFTVFLFYQLLYAKSFKGDGHAFLTLLNLSALVGTLTGFAYLVYYGWTIAWWAPIVAFAACFAMLPGVVAEKIFGSLVLSMAGFFVWPISAYYMFTLLAK